MTLPIISMLTLLACALAAGWPLLFLPRVRPALLGAGGTGCIGLGSAIMALVASGFAPMPGCNGPSHRRRPGRFEGRESIG